MRVLERRLHVPSRRQRRRGREGDGVSRQRLIIAAIAIAPTLAHADDPQPSTSSDSPTQKPTDASVAPVAPADMSDQAIGASIGVATGGGGAAGGGGGGGADRHWRSGCGRV